MKDCTWDSIFAVHEYFSKSQISIDYLNKIWFANYDPFRTSPLTCFSLYWEITGHRFNQNISFNKELAFNTRYLFLSALDLEDISPIQNLYNLEIIECYGNAIDSFVPLKKLEHLKEVKAAKNKISNLEPLSNLMNLEVIELMDNHITNISPLFRLTNLKELGLAGNKIQDINLLSNLRHLKLLDLRYNDVKSIIELKGLPGLEILKLEGNQIGINKIIELGRILRNCKIFFDFLEFASDYTPLNGYLYFKNIDGNDVPFFVNYTNKHNVGHVTVALLDKYLKSKRNIIDEMKDICRDIINFSDRENHIIRNLKREHFFEETSHFLRAQFDY